MAQTVILTGVGRDRVGIVSELTDALFELGCNLLDSSMTLLRGEFAVILMASLPDGLSVEVLSNRLEAVQSELGFILAVRSLSESELESAPNADPIFVISVYGADRPGIVSGITRKLAELGANLTDVQTTRAREQASVFIMILETRVPATVTPQKLESELKSIANALSCDISVRELEEIEL